MSDVTYPLKCIAVVDPDDAARRATVAMLRSAGFRTKQFASLTDWDNQPFAHNVDLVVSEWRFVDQTAINQLARIVRPDRRPLPPLVVLAATNTEPDVIEALTFGFDDYIQKSGRRAELVERIRRILRHAQGNHTQSLDIAALPFRLNRRERRLYLRDQLVRTSDLEFMLLECLFQRAGHLVSWDQLSLHVGIARARTRRALSAAVGRLRKRIRLDGTEGWLLRSERDKGYVLQPISSSAGGDDGPLPTPRQVRQAERGARSHR